MEDVRNNKAIKRKVKNMVENLKIPKTAIGRLLLKKENADKQTAFQKTIRFFSEKHKVNIEELEILSKFFNKPISYFLDNQEIRGDNNLQIHNGDNGVIKVSHDQKELIEQILKIEEKDKEIIKILIKKFLK